MAITANSETRVQNTVLATTQAHILPEITNNAVNAHVGLSLFEGQLLDQMFGRQASPMGKKTWRGESIEVRVKLGKTTASGALASEYSEFSRDTQDTATTTRANWKFYGTTAIISGAERRNNAGMERIANLLEYKTREAIEGMADDLALDLYDNGGDSTKITGLEQIISANDSLQGISGATYSHWNSRGVTAKGTAAASIDHTGGSFASTGVDNWILAWMNASEGMIQPKYTLTTEDIYRYYEATLAPEIRFRSSDTADGSFAALAFKQKPVFHDSYCTSGTTYFINPDYLYMVVSPGADFDMTPMRDQDFQDVYSSKGLFQGNLVCSARKFQNKVDTQTA